MAPPTMKPLHDGLDPSPLASDTATMADAPKNMSRGRARPSRRRPALLLGALLSPLSVAASQHQHHEQPQPLPGAASQQRVLQDGLTACANCNTATLTCRGTTVQDQHCAPCATGQTWWPCNLPNECYCHDSTIVVTQPPRPDCDIPLCEAGESGSRVVPFTNCEFFTVCTAGSPGPEQSCPPGQLFSESINACNVHTLVECPPDPGCPPTGEPTLDPDSTEMPTTAVPTYSMMPTASPRTSGGVQAGVNVGSSTGATGSTTDGAGSQEKSSPSRPPPDVLEGMYVMDAHMAANKIVLTRELLAAPARGKSGSNEFSYVGLRNSLHQMISTGVANQTFYIGHANVENGRAYGLVNIAAFLAMSVEDSIGHGSCDEVNRDIVGGVLPISNACGQYGMDYSRMNCPREYTAEGEEIDYACAVDPTMSMTAGPIDGSKGDESPPRPLYCRPKEFDGDYTGHWDYVSGTEFVDVPVTNAAGRQDVEGCCWWGRGSIQLRGTCDYGRLEYHLGSRAAREGRPALFPDVDFCQNPQAVCSHPKYPDLRWTAGMFRWITDVQTYNQGEFNYMQRLIDFVDGGMQDWTFVHGLSGIVTQGCHAPPCVEGMEFDGVQRKATFIKTLRLLGLRVDDGTATGRRLGGSR